MTIAREAVFAEVERRLRLIAGDPEVRRMPNGDPVSFPALHIFDGGQQIVEGEAGTTRYGCSITIEGYMEGDGDAAAHAALNDLYGATVIALMGEPPLDGLAETIDEGDLRIEIAPLAGKNRLCFGVDFLITFPTRRGDPSLTA